MNLNLVNDLFNNLKENKFVQNFIKELSNYLENSITNNKKIFNNDSSLIDINLDDLTLYGEKVTAKYRDKMLIEREQILQKYSENTKEKGEMYYIYAVNSNDSNSFNLCICKSGKSHQVISKSKEELPEGATLGSVLRKNDVDFVIDNEGTKCVGAEINKMIKEKIEEQHKYLDSKRVEGHIYEVDEKYSGRIWLYDLNGNASEGIEEVEFPKSLYETAKTGDKFIYQNGEYQKYEF